MEGDRWFNLCARELMKTGAWMFGILAVAIVDFGAMAPRAAGQQVASQVVTCGSNDGLRKICSTPYGNISNVQMMRQMSGLACTEGKTWGFDARTVWVDRGCVAQFRVYAWSGGWNGGGNSKTVRCKSEDMRFNHCPVNGWLQNAQLAQQNSGSPCIQDQTWGWDASGVWVDRGCRADFRVWTGSRPTGRSVVTRCKSDDMRLNSCRVSGFIIGAQVERQYSNSPCTQGKTWGFDNNGLWVDRGCRADFRVWLGR
jgi:hypothetical protein